jgi:Uroporphyrinogen-III synthase
VSRLRALGQVAWSFPLIEFSPGRELSALTDRMNTLQAGDLLFALSQHEPLPGMRHKKTPAIKAGVKTGL